MSGTAPLFVGIDVGTTLTKAGVVDRRGRELACAAVPTRWQPSPTGGHAHPDDLLASVWAALGQVLAVAPPGEIAGVGVTSMAETVVLVGRDGEAIEPAVAWYDTRAADAYAALRRHFGAAYSRTTGLGTPTIPTVATLRWLVDHVPGARDAVRAFSVAEWIVHRLGGDGLAEASLASRTGAFAVLERCWWPEALEWAGVPPTLFPPVRDAGSSFGRVGRVARLESMGRLEGAVLTVGGHDHLCAAVGNGVVHPDQVMDSCGTAEALVRAVPARGGMRPEAGLALGIETGCHVLPGHFALLGGLALGLALIPLLDELGTGAERGCTVLDEAALRLADTGVPLDGDSCAPPAGASPSRAPALVAGEAPAVAWRRALSAVVSRSRHLLDGLVQLGGPVREVRLSGGWAANPVLRQLKAAVVERPVYPDVAEAGVRGAALLSAVAAGHVASIGELPEPSLDGELVKP